MSSLSLLEVLRVCLRLKAFDLLQEVNGWAVGNTGLLHLLPQILRLAKLANVIQFIPLKENQEFVGIVGVAEEVTSPRTTGLTVGGVLIEDRLPPGVVLNLVSN